MVFYSDLSTLGFPFLNLFMVIIEPLDNSWIRLNVFLNIDEVDLHFEPAIVESIVVEPFEPSFQWFSMNLQVFPFIMLPNFANFLLFDWIDFAIDKE
jgi:hypothetical protein